MNSIFTDHIRAHAGVAALRTVHVLSEHRALSHDNMPVVALVIRGGVGVVKGVWSGASSSGISGGGGGGIGGGVGARGSCGYSGSSGVVREYHWCSVRNRRGTRRLGTRPVRNNKGIN